MRKIKTLSNISDMWNEKKYELAAKASVIPGFLWAQRIVYANELAITENITKTSGNVLKEISTAYCNSLCWLFFMVELCVFAFSKDEKKIAMAKKCFIGCLVIYIFFKLIGTDGGVVGSSVDKISDWMGGK